MIRNMSFYQTCSSTSTNNQSRIQNPESRHALIQYKVENAYPFSSRWPIRSFWSRLGIPPHGILGEEFEVVGCPHNEEFAGLTPSCCLPHGILSSLLLALRHPLPVVCLTASFPRHCLTAPFFNCWSCYHQQLPMMHYCGGARAMAGAFTWRSGSVAVVI